MLGTQGYWVLEVEEREAHGTAAGAKRHTGKVVGGTGKWQRSGDRLELEGQF